MITMQEMWLEFLWCWERLQWKSGMPRIGVGDAEIKIDEKRVNNHVPLSLESEIKPIKCQNCPLFTSKTQIKTLFYLFCATDCPVLEVKGKINV